MVLMAAISTDLVQLVTYLLPGFLTAWIFYGLTPFRKPSEFERIIQALVFTGIIRLFVLPINFVCNLYNIKMPTEVEFLASWVVALLLGVVSSRCVNTGWLHAKLRKCKLTNSMSLPSSWAQTLSINDGEVKLFLKDDKRILVGWTYIHPDMPDDGEFVIEDPTWETEEGESKRLEGCKYLIVRAQDVAHVGIVDELDSWEARWSKSNDKTE